MYNNISTSFYHNTTLLHHYPTLPDKNSIIQQLCQMGEVNEWLVTFIVLLGVVINNIFLDIRYFIEENSSEDRSNIIWEIFIVVTGMGLVWTWHGKSITKEIKISREELRQNFQQSREEQREQHREMMEAIVSMTTSIKETNAISSRTLNAIGVLSEDVAILSENVNYMSNNITSKVDEMTRVVRSDIRGLVNKIK